MNHRHTEFFGPDLARGPFSSHRIETSALQIATALAQLRAPVARSDDALRAHAEFIRELADRLAPDWAVNLGLAVSPEVADTIRLTITAPVGTYSLLELWLADGPGGGPTSLAPASVSFGVGTVLETVQSGTHFRVLTSEAGVIDVSVTDPGTRAWYWAVTRLGRVYYSTRLAFT